MTVKMRHCDCRALRLHRPRALPVAPGQPDDERDVPAGRRNLIPIMDNKYVFCP